jgi:hypothetical protein
VPEISVTGWIQYSYVESPAITFQKVPGASGCDTEIQLDITLPVPTPCPTFESEVTVFEHSNYTGWLDITPTPPVSPGDPCTYALDLNIGIPTPCIPTITATGSIIVAPGRDEPWIQVQAVAVDAPTGCSKKIQVDIELPVDKKGKLKKGDITCAWTVCEATDPTCTVSISEPDENHEQKLDIAIYIPRPPVYTGGAFTLRDANNNVYGTGVISIDATGCSRGVSGVVYLNTASCGPTGPGGI